MNERERLIELLKSDSCESPMLCDPNCKYANLKRCYEERTADYLLESGVIILPCSIGDTVYYHKTLCDCKYTVVIEEDTVKRFLINRIEMLAMISFDHALSFDDFGKTVFLTREEAEKALKEREENA